MEGGQTHLGNPWWSGEADEMNQRINGKQKIVIF